MHLIISVIFVIPAAIVYGFSPNTFELFPRRINAYSFCKAVMGLYLGFSLLWMLGVFKSAHLKNALISNMIFMLGLGFGRVLSMIFDGVPTVVYALGAIGELFLGVYGVWVLKRLKHQQ